MSRLLHAFVVALCIASVAGQCVPQTFNTSWDYINQQDDASLIVIVPAGFHVDYDIRPIYTDSEHRLDAVIDGGSGLVASLTQNGKQFLLTVTNFDASPATPGDLSGASARTTSPSFHTYFVTIIVGALSLVFGARVPTVMGMMCAFVLVATFASTTPMTAAAQGGCTAKITITISRSLRVDLNQANAANVVCPVNYISHPTAGCVDWQSEFSRIYSDPSNDPQCDALVTSTYQIYAPYTGRAIALSASGATYPISVYLAPKETPFGTATVLLANGGMGNLTIWWGDEGYKDFTILPITVDTASLHCGFAYTCVNGDCGADIHLDDSLCVSRQLIHPSGCNSTTCSWGAVQCSSYCSDKTATTCNAGLCPGTDSECPASGFCLCFTGNVFGGAESIAASFALLVVLIVSVLVVSN